MIKAVVAGLTLTLVAVLTLAMVVRMATSDERVDVTDLEAGDCFDFPAVPEPADDGQVSAVDLVELVGCDEPHTAEAVLVGVLNPERDRPYPADAELFTTVDRRCATVPDDPRFGIVPIAPTESTWNGRGGRFVCVAVSFGLEPVVGRHRSTDV